jgi:hypothetical protein
MFLRTFKQHSTCYSSPPPCLNDCSSSSIKVRDIWPLEKYKILVPLYTFFEIFKGILHVKTFMILLHWWVPPYVICRVILLENLQKIHRKIIHTQVVVVKEVIKKRCFGFRVDAKRSLWNFQCRNSQCIDKNG